MDKPIAVLIPVYGNQQLTWKLLRDVESERHLTEVYIIDNRGDYIPRRDEIVVSVEKNLGWVKGLNLGIDIASQRNHQAFVFLNNDTRLSRQFFEGLISTHHETAAGLIGPMYDDVYEHQVVLEKVPASEYRPLGYYEAVPFVDGTCMYVPRQVLQEVGKLDEKHFGRFGWGADLDYCFRVRMAGHSVYVTHLSYLNHKRGSTAKKMVRNYDEIAGPEMIAGLSEKWGPNWREEQLLLCREGQTLT